MSKGKKEPLVSLVSAYDDSGAESSDNDDDTESNNAGTAEKESAGNDEESCSNMITDEDTTSQATATGTAAATVAESTRSQTSGAAGTIEEGSNAPFYDSSEEFHKEDVHKSNDDEQKRQHDILNDEARASVKKFKENVLNESNEASSSPRSVDNENLYSIENGFPPGCEYIRLPPTPKAQCSQTLQAKIVQVMDRMKYYNYSINEDIHKKKSFKNPSIYEKLIEVYGIDEFGSSFISHIEDLKSQGYMFYDELDQAQRAEWAKKEKERKDKTKIEMISAVKKK